MNFCICLTMGLIKNRYFNLRVSFKNPEVISDSIAWSPGNKIVFLMTPYQ